MSESQSILCNEMLVVNFILKNFFLFIFFRRNTISFLLHGSWWSPQNNRWEMVRKQTLTETHMCMCQIYNHKHWTIIDFIQLMSLRLWWPVSCVYFVLCSVSLWCLFSSPPSPQSFSTQFFHTSLLFQFIIFMKTSCTQDDNPAQHSTIS